MTAASPDRQAAPPSAMTPPAAGAALSLPLSRLLAHAADAVQAVRAGRSLDAALADCPAAARPGTQALAFHAMRWLGGAQAVRARLAPKPPAPAVDALLLTALALLWHGDAATATRAVDAAPDAAAPDAAAPAAAAPAAAAPAAAAPHAVPSDAATSTAMAPSAATPDAEAPAAAAPHTVPSDAAASAAMAPTAATPDAKAPDAAAPDAVNTEAAATVAVAPTAGTADGAAPGVVNTGATATDAPLIYPAHTLVDQAVTAARQRRGAAAAPSSSKPRQATTAGGGGAKDAAFVNAVLRRFLRERASLVDGVRRDDPVARHNHPDWWVERLRLDWPTRWQPLLQANQGHPPMTLRVNTLRGDVMAYLRRLADAGIAAQPGDLGVAPHAIVLAQPCPVSRLPGFADGDVSVQDAAAQRAAPLLIGLTAEGALSSAWRLPAGARVLDACAAPGGKTAHLLELAELDLLAIDSDAQRLRRVDDTLARLHLRARTLAADAGNPAAWWDGRPFDAILLDAPCSASGIVRRHPDVRWLRRAGDIPRLARTQGRLLDALWPTLAVGGRLLYATCSVFKAEGQQPIDAFLQRHADARPAAAPPSPGHLLPLADNHGAAAGNPPADGFFYALLEKH